MKVFELLPRPLGKIFRKLTHFTCNSPIKNTNPRAWWGARAVPIPTRFTPGPLPATIMVRIVVGAWIDDRSRIDRRSWRHDRRCWRHDRRCWRHDRRRGNHHRGRRHNRRRGDHHGVRGHDVMRERHCCCRQAHDARRETKSAVMVVVVVVPPRECARCSRQRKSHN